MPEIDYVFENALDDFAGFVLDMNCADYCFGAGVAEWEMSPVQCVARDAK